MFISKRKINSNLRNELKRTAGYREKEIMDKSKWVSSANNGRLIKFTMRNPNYKKNRFETTKTFSATYDTKRKTWVN